MTRVSIEDLHVAAEWLECNEGTDNGEMDSCRRVAEWLRDEAEKRGKNSDIARLSREFRIPRSEVRKAIDRQFSTKK